MDSILMTFAIPNGNPNATALAGRQAREEAAVHSLEPPLDPNWKSYAKRNPLAIKSLPRAADIQWLDAPPFPGKPNRLPSSPSVTARIIWNVTEAIRSAGRKFIPLRKLASSEWSMSRISPNLLTPATTRGWGAIYEASPTKGWSAYWFQPCFRSGNPEGRRELTRCGGRGQKECTRAKHTTAGSDPTLDGLRRAKGLWGRSRPSPRNGGGVLPACIQRSKQT